MKGLLVSGSLRQRHCDYMGTLVLSACQCNYRSVKTITHTAKKVSRTRCRERERQENDRARITHRNVIAARGTTALNMYIYGTRLHRNDAIDISFGCVRRMLHANITKQWCENRTFIFSCTQNPMFDPRVQILCTIN